MKFLNLIFLSSICLLFHCSQTPKSISSFTYEHPIPYQPNTYVCYQTNEAIQIDGKLTEAAWQNIPSTDDFVDIEGQLKPNPPYQTTVKMLWDEKYFYFGAYLEEPHVWGKLKQRDTVIFYDNDFEIFLDPDGDTHYYYEFEMNALNTVWDLLLMRPYREGGGPKVLDSWDIQGLKTGVDVQGTLNDPSDEDRSWTVEVAIPWKVLEEMTPDAFRPKEGVQWKVNFSRVHWYTDIVNGNYQKKKGEDRKNLPAENWVWSPQGYINMHAPETWGLVQFTENSIEEGEVEFIHSPDEEVKWALRQLYYQQRQYFAEHKIYAEDLQAFAMPQVDIDGYQFTPRLYTTPYGYEMVAKGVDGEKEWVIDNDGRILAY